VCVHAGSQLHLAFTVSCIGRCLRTPLWLTRRSLARSHARRPPPPTHGRLSLILRKRGAALPQVLEDVEYALSTVVRLDAIAARARYALWQGGCRPVFVDAAPPPVSNRQAKEAAAAAAAASEENEPRGQRSAEDEYSELLIWVQRLQHPLLLAKAAGNKRVGPLL
jgi:hypothetical protein